VQLGVAPYYRVIDWQYGVSSSGRPLRLAVAPEAGFRFTYLRGEIDVHHGPTVDQNESWVEPLIGSRFTLDLADRWTLAAEANVGGFGVGSDFAWNAQALLGYRTILLGRETTFALAIARCTRTTTTTTSNGTRPYVDADRVAARRKRQLALAGEQHLPGFMFLAADPGVLAVRAEAPVRSGLAAGARQVFVAAGPAVFGPSARLEVGRGH
jgi:hypothetical protein